MLVLFLLLLFYLHSSTPSSFNIFSSRTELERKYGSFSEELRLEMLDQTRQMFYHGYNNYMEHAFPLDELNPLLCSGRGPDYDNPGNLNINDVLGDYSLTLVDTLDTLAIIGNYSEFRRAVKLIVEQVGFDKPNVVQVFEANIRLLGGLLSAHLLMEDPNFPDLAPDWYLDDLLSMSHDLADRLLPAFEQTETGLPFPRVNLKHGLPENGSTHTCTAGVGSILLEFIVLSSLTGDPIYELYARKAVRSLYKLRNNKTGLVGNVVDVNSGEWKGKVSGLGAGIDSFFEILLKSFIMFGDGDDLEMFEESYAKIKQYMRRGRPHCNQGSGLHPLYVNVEMETGDTATNWIDSLQAAFPGVQVLYGDIDEAICHHVLYYSIWKKYGCLPERYNWKLDAPDVKFYPLRPELVESTYLLYQATKNPFYLHVGRDILYSLNNHTRAECGYATVHDVTDMSLEDRQESFFLSETVKYLYLLFDTDNPLNRNYKNYIFTTEGHILPLAHRFRHSPWAGEGLFDPPLPPLENLTTPSSPPSTTPPSSPPVCDTISAETRFSLPLRNQYLEQVFAAFGVS